MRGAWGLGSLVGLAVGWACGGQSFTCGDDEQCQPGGGTCVEGYCAFASDECSSGLQWGDYAGPVSGTCVPEGGSETSAPDPSTGPADPTDDPADASTTLDPADTSASATDGPLPSEVEFRDDALRGEFGAGVMRGVGWTGDRLALTENGTQGSFTSRVYDAGEPVTWQTVQWQPDGPYGKPLPDGGAAEVGYPQGGADMTANVLLMHFEDPEGLTEWSDETPVLDASGAASHGVLESGSTPVALVPGIFGTAIDDQWQSRIDIPTQGNPALAFDTDDFTWALWVRMSSECTTNQVYMGIDDSEAGFDIFPHLWLGCTDDVWGCDGNVAAPRAAGTFRSVHDNPRDGASFCGPEAIDGDVWRHLAVVKQGHDAAALSLYVDGVLVDTVQASFTAPIVYPNGSDFTIGAFSRDTYRAEAVLDEVAVWRRALAAEEVAGVYQRGVTSLHVLVRVCQQPGCADEPPWIVSLADPPQALVAGSELAIDGQPVGQYAQYRLELAGGGGVPALRSVTVRGMR